MKLDFKIDENLLIAYALKNITSKESSLVPFQDFAWGKSATLYDFLIGRHQPKSLNEDALQKNISELPAYFKEIKESNEYKEIFRKTSDHLNEVKSEWEKNFTKTLSIIKELTGWEEELKKNFNVYILHPSLNIGNHPQKETILWGKKAGWANYFSVYLWHEILHDYLENNDTNHAVIELIADNEMRTHLNGGTYPPFEGHEHLNEIKNKILPLWKKHLEKRGENITEFLSDIH